MHCGPLKLLYWPKINRKRGFSRLRVTRWFLSNDPSNSARGLTKFLLYLGKRYEPFNRPSGGCMHLLMQVTVKSPVFGRFCFAHAYRDRSETHRQRNINIKLTVPNVEKKNAGWHASFSLSCRRRRVSKRSLPFYAEALFKYTSRFKLIILF